MIATSTIAGVDLRSCASRPSVRCGGAQRGFSMVELLVVMSLMVVLLGLVSAAVSGARASSKQQATRLLISKLDAIVRQQLATYNSREVPPPAGGLPTGWTMAGYRSWYIRRNLITGDLPDRWGDVMAMASGQLSTFLNGNGPRFPITQPQTVYASTWNSWSSAKQALVGDQYAGAECLFMIVTQGGIADCLDCGELRTAERGDKDNDSAYEFWDAWGNPIGFILWPAGLELPVGAKFFAGSRALEQAFPPKGTSPSPTLGMIPLIYSAGPDQEYGINRANEVGVLVSDADPNGLRCGDWSQDPTASMASPISAYASDNITNLDAEAAR